MLEKANKDIRSEAKRNGVKLWQIAVRYGVNDGNFSRKLRMELPQEEKAIILGIIQTITKEREAVS